MKINWGTGIVIAMIAFMSFILYFVVKMFTDDQYEYDLVVEEYYKQEIGFQDELNAEKNAIELAEKVVIEQTEIGVLIDFPGGEASSNIDGIVTFYRPSNKNLDFTKVILLEDQKMFIPKNEIAAGRWNISVRWNQNGKTYLTRKNINF
ncbi:MAG TPA: FixH family protein [Gillisia sp.]|nr:FixH family protein [Gillisia sp.]